MRVGTLLTFAMLFFLSASSSIAADKEALRQSFFTCDGLEIVKDSKVGGKDLLAGRIKPGPLQIVIRQDSVSFNGIRFGPDPVSQLRITRETDFEIEFSSRPQDGLHYHGVFNRVSGQGWLAADEQVIEDHPDWWWQVLFDCHAAPNGSASAPGNDQTRRGTR